MDINVLIDEGFEEQIDINWLQGIAGRVLVAQSADSNTELGLVIVGQEKIRELNSKYLGKNEPTDVIAFSMLPEPADKKLTEKDLPPFATPPDGISHLGEVIISYPQAVLQAEEQRHSVRREITILIIHGILHLLGYDDLEPELKQQMRVREAEILSNIEEKSR